MKYLDKLLGWLVMAVIALATIGVVAEHVDDNIASWPPLVVVAIISAVVGTLGILGGLLIQSFKGKHRHHRSHGRRGRR